VTLGERDDERVMMLVFDLSPSFMDKIVKTGEGYTFAMNAVSRYFRGSAGSQERLVIAQLSGTDKSLVWEGKPMDLRKQFPTPESFRDYLVSKADPSGSKIYRGLRLALQYLFSDPRVHGGQTKAVVLVLSPMNDKENYPDPQEKGYLNHEICELGWRQGAIGFYFVDQHNVVQWRESLLVWGVKNSVVESEVVGKPQLPNFE
jgi:hypothetical protein